MRGRSQLAFKDFFEVKAAYLRMQKRKEIKLKQMMEDERQRQGDLARSARVTTTNFTTTELEGEGTTVVEGVTNVDGTTNLDRTDAQTSKIKTEVQDQTPEATQVDEPS